MKNQLKNATLFLCFLVLITTLSSFSFPQARLAGQETVSKTIEQNQAGKAVIKTQILLNRTTSREAIIAACAALSKENVQLTFNKLVIRKSFLGLMGNSRIAFAQGQIQLPDGSVEKFKAGGPFNFRFIKIIYFQDSQTGKFNLGMVEKVD